MRLVTICLAALTLTTTPALAETYVLPATVAQGGAAAGCKDIRLEPGSTLDARQVTVANDPNSMGYSLTVDIPNGFYSIGACGGRLSGVRNVEGTPNGIVVTMGNEGGTVHGYAPGRGAADTIIGGDGDDTIITDGPFAVIDGGAGNDTAIVTDWRKPVKVKRKWTTKLVDATRRDNVEHVERR